MDHNEEQEERQVQVRFKTRQKQYEITDSAILVPVRLRRFGLSEIVNHLLNTNNNKIPFDFIIDGKFLRTSLGAYLEANHLSSENVLEVEYIESSQPPKPSVVFDQDDWISSIAAPHQRQYIATGSFDGTARLFNSSGECVATMGHDGPLKSVAWLNNDVLLAAGEDQLVTAWQISQGPDNELATSTLFQAVGHAESIECVAARPDGEIFASSGWDSLIHVWSGSLDDLDGDMAQEAQVQVSGKKKKRLSDRKTPKKEPIGVLDGHVGTVSAVVFHQVPGANPTMYSGGWDHSVRVWDVDASSGVHTMGCENVILSIDHSQHSGLLVTGHSDNCVRVWDPRDQKGLVVKLKLVSHHGMVTQVKWSPSSVYSLASASQDSQVKVWDIRSSTPLHSLHTNPTSPKSKTSDKNNGNNNVTDSSNRLFAMDWDSSNTLYAGGESKRIVTFTI